MLGIGLLKKFKCHVSVDDDAAVRCELNGELCCCQRLALGGMELGRHPAL